MKKTCMFLLMMFAGLATSSAQEIIEVADTTSETSVPEQNYNNKPQISNLKPQTLKPQILIGFLSYDSALVSMPEYAIAQQRIAETRQAYDDEMKRVEREFNDKYEEFLENRKDYPRTILLKRQTELQELLEKNIEFKNKSRKELQQIERQILAPLRIRLNETIATIARQQQLTMVVNTDSNACPFLEPMQSVDLNERVIKALGN